jgi:hypothetical protein
MTGLQRRCDPHGNIWCKRDVVAIAQLEEAVVATGAQAKEATIEDLGSAVLMVDLVDQIARFIIEKGGLKIGGIV